MKFSLDEIKKVTASGPFTFDQTIDVKDLATLDNDIRKIEEVRAFGSCTKDGDQYIFSFKLNGEMVLPCARTLVDVDYPFEINVLEIFSESPYLTKEDKENEIHPIDSGMIDLTPWIKENIMLAVPFRVYAPEEVLKSAKVKGQGWELTVEGDSEEQKSKSNIQIDPRLKKLKSLLDKKQNEK